MASDESKEISVMDKKQIQKSDGEPTKAGFYYTPAVDIYETGEAITLLADLPGVEKEGLDIDIEDKQLTITGDVTIPGSEMRPVYEEYGIGGYTRSFRLGDVIDQSRISATLKDGVLTLVLPKAEAAKPRKVEIASA